MAAHASASESEGPYEVVRHDEVSLTVAPPTAHPASVAQSTLRLQIPKLEAVCGKAARTALCGGRIAICVPTAILISFQVPPHAERKTGFVDLNVLYHSWVGSSQEGSGSRPGFPADWFSLASELKAHSPSTAPASCRSRTRTPRTRARFH